VYFPLCICSSSHGYFQTWLGEFYYVSDETFKEEYIHLNENAIHVYNNDIVNEFEHCSIPKHIVVMQLESVDWRTFNTSIMGSPMVPTLFELGARGTVFKMETIHIIGSLDSDFTILTNTLPSGRIASYKLSGLDLEGNLIESVNKAGYQSSIIHPFRITYFDRDLVLNKLPLHHTIFSENMHDYLRGQEDNSPNAQVWPFSKKNRDDNRVVNAWGFPDSDMFQISNSLFKSSSDQQFHFLISFRTHFPFRITNEVVEGNTSLDYDKPFSTWEKYHHSVLHLDSLISQYIHEVPDGTRFYIFGDHEAPVQFPKESGFTKEANTKPEHVPLIVWQKGCDSRPDPAQNNDVTRNIHLLQLSDHLKYYFDSQNPAATKILF